MAKLVMTFTIGDGCSWSCDETLPIEYESPEALIVDFMEAAWKAHREKTKFIFAGYEFWLEMFIRRTEEPFNGNGKKQMRQIAPHYYEDPPTIQTLEEWFAENKINNA